LPTTAISVADPYADGLGELVILAAGSAIHLIFLKIVG